MDIHEIEIEIILCIRAPMFFFRHSSNQGTNKYQNHVDPTMASNRMRSNPPSCRMPSNQSRSRLPTPSTRPLALTLGHFLSYDYKSLSFSLLSVDKGYNHNLVEQEFL